jgi:assimilatory nitrate reductase catalytic subunit
VLNTGRYRDQWHTMTRTAQSARLLQHRSEPLLSIHPEDARSLGLTTGAIAQVSSRHGALLLRVSEDSSVQKGQVFAPMHWTDVYASNARVNSLIPAHTDPLSGQPESKHAVVAIQPWQAVWEGWCITRDTTWQPSCAYWVKVPLGNDVILWWLADITPLSTEQYCTQADIRYQDSAQGIWRSAHLIDEQPHTVFFSAPKQDDRLPLPDWVKTLFNAPLSEHQRLSLLAGFAPSGQEQGATVCACFQVGEKTIQRCIDQGSTSIEAIGVCCQAGTNCGSCIPEIKHHLQQRGV